MPELEEMVNNNAAEERKACPLKLIGGNNSYAQDPFCEKGQCAWWLNQGNGCAILLIAGERANNSSVH